MIVKFLEFQEKGKYLNDTSEKRFIRIFPWPFLLTPPFIWVRCRYDDLEKSLAGFKKIKKKFPNSTSQIDLFLYFIILEH